MEQKKRLHPEKSASKRVYETEKTSPSRKKCVKAGIWNRKNISIQKKVRQGGYMKQKKHLHPEESASKRVYGTEKHPHPEKSASTSLPYKITTKPALKKTLRPEPECFRILI
ncbi:hypothetical protein [Metabacillus dongyingensis]|uniref:hypothetical protein n=1 Tax=Metabacillus dongyingensis TaxID=2874282 RepID=UPI001CBE56F8|nr:hypothetical protein [Metabacillus dongyingensis]UAL51153.1 hypothetical protein K8L98_18295 [Metabacillus dongyingensis]